MGKQSDMSPRDIYAYAEKLEQRIRSLETRSPWFGTGAHPNGLGGVDSDNFVSGASGYRLAATPEFNDIRLRGGIIGNDALTSPVVPDYLFNSISGFGLTPSLTNIQTVTLTVPAGCTRLSAFIVGRVYATNNTAGLDYLYAQTNVAGYNGNALPLAVSASNGSGTNISPFAVLLTGLTPGSTLTVQMAAQTAFASWASSAGNISELNGSLNWFR